MRRTTTTGWPHRSGSWRRHPTATPWCCSLPTSPCRRSGTAAGRGAALPRIYDGRRPARTLAAFRAAPGSILLATGAAWEGLDFAGDGVSLLIIPRLPFAYPDAVKEKEREDYPNLREFLRSVVVPEMQIKLRQGFGRAIRTETDTCAVAMLDPRAARGRRYFQSMVEALPEMPVTGSLRAVEQFYRDRKGAGYFRLPNAG